MKSIIVAAILFVASAPSLAVTVAPSWYRQADSQSVAYSPNGALLATGGEGTHLWAAANGGLVRTLTARFDNSQAVAFSTDGVYVAGGSGSFNQNLNIWRVADGQVITERVTAHNNGVESVAFSPTAPILATSGRDAETKLWTVPDLKFIRSIPSGKRTFSVAFFPDGATLATGGQHGVSIWDVATGALVRTLEGASDVNSISISPNGQMVAAAHDVIDTNGNSVDSTIRVWRAADGTLLRTLQKPGTYGTYAVAFSPDGKYIAAGGDSRVNDGYEGYFRIWRVSDGVIVKNVSIPDPEHIGLTAVLSIDYSPNGKQIAYTRYDALLTVIPNPF